MKINKFHSIISRFIPPFQLILLLTFFHENAGASGIREYETTRLKSTAGAGVGSLLLNEGAILNPASMAFFETSSLHLQFERHRQEGGPAHSEEDPSFMKNKSLIIADTKRMGKAAFSYQDLYAGHDHRQRFTVGTGFSLSKTSGIGMSMRHTNDDFKSGSTTHRDRYTQFSVGATHVIADELSVGAILIDPLKTRQRDTRIILGAQFMVSQILALIGDVGTFYENDPSETLLYKAAIQVTILNDFYLRGGVFNDKSLKEKGNGIGFSWVGPRLALDAALKTTKATGEGGSLSNGEKVSETSLSLSLLF